MGFGCNHSSKYNISSNDQNWFISLIKENKSINSKDPSGSLYYPQDGKNIAIASINYNEWLILIIMIATNVQIASNITIAAFEQISYIFYSTNNKINLSDLQKLDPKNKLAICEGCKTKNQCFSRFFLGLKI